jgi:hypothetical protein
MVRQRLTRYIGTTDSIEIGIIHPTRHENKPFTINGAPASHATRIGTDIGSVDVAQSRIGALG